MEELKSALCEHVQVLDSALKVFQKHCNESLRPLYTHLDGKFQLMNAELQPLYQPPSRK